MMAQELDITNELVKRDIEDFCHRTFEKIRKNFETLGISPFNKSNYRANSKAWLKGGTPRSTGALYRSIFWKVFNEAGGDMWKVEFFFKHYATFVETGTGAGVKWSPLPELRKLQTIKRKGTRRVAKPFLMSEIRMHAKMTLQKLAEHVGYAGGIKILRSVAEIPEGASEETIARIFEGKR